MKQVTVAKPLLKPASSKQVRSKFFHMIGIDGAASSSSASSSSSPVQGHGWSAAQQHIDPTAPQATQRLQPPVCVQKAPLRYDRMADREAKRREKRLAEAAEIMSTAVTADSTTTPKQKKRISFDNSVAVVPIPMRTEYSDRVRTRMWSNAVEIHENAARNSVEFAAEGLDDHNGVV